MKRTNRFFAGMAAMVIALAFASCGAAENTADISTETVKTEAAAATADHADKADRMDTVKAVSAAKQAAPAETEDELAAKIREFLEAARTDNREAFETAADRDAVFAAMKSVNPEMPDEELCTEENFDNFVDLSFKGDVLAMEGFGADFSIAYEKLTEDELKELMGYEVMDVKLEGYGVTVTDESGKKENFCLEVNCPADGKTLYTVTALTASPDDQMINDIANSNARTLYNTAAEFCYTNAPFADGTYEYTVGGDSSDELGKSINEIFGIDPEFEGSVCEIVVKNGEPEKVSFKPAGQSGVTGTYTAAEAR